MRAYTSLVGHLLGSHPEIDGYYEMHQSYRSAADLESQAQRYAEHDPPKAGSRYLFDKLLHNDYTLALEALDPAPTVVLMSLRPPAPTLKSIVSLFARKPGDDPYADPAGAAAYYVARLHAASTISTPTWFATTVSACSRRSRAGCGWARRYRRTTARSRAPAPPAPAIPRRRSPPAASCPAETTMRKSSSTPPRSPARRRPTPTAGAS